MENTEYRDSIFGFTLTPNLKYQLAAAAKWGKIMAIVGFINSGVNLLAQFSKGGRNAEVSVTGALVSAAIAIVVYVYLLNFGRKVSKGIEEMEQGIFNDGLNDLRLYFKIAGILVIVALSIMVLAFLIVVLFSAGNNRNF